MNERENKFVSTWELSVRLPGARADAQGVPEGVDAFSGSHQDFIGTPRVVGHEVRDVIDAVLVA